MNFNGVSFISLQVILTLTDIGCNDIMATNHTVSFQARFAEFAESDY